jgi:hypothetical protein
MTTCSDSERVALKDAGPLLRFAAEHVKKLDPDLSLAIAEARAAVENNQWTAQISQRFWIAYNQLCTLIDPVTMDGLSVAEGKVKKFRWFGLGGTEEVSLAERSANRYFVVLIALVVPFLFGYLYVWTCTNLTKQIDDLLTQDKPRITQLTDDFNKLDIATRSKEATTWIPEEVAKAEKISADSNSLIQDADRINYSARILDETFFRQATSLFTSSSRPKSIDTKSRGQWYDDYETMQKRFGNLQENVPQIQARANLIVGIFGAFVLPVLLGSIGAVAYVIRLISDQINAATFTRTSPIRHITRVGRARRHGRWDRPFQQFDLAIQPVAACDCFPRRLWRRSGLLDVR